MVTIELFYRDEQLVAYELAGHASSRGRGQEFDLVCAAISVLAITFTNGLTEVLHLQPEELLVEDGRLRFVMPPDLDDKQSIQADTLLKTLVLGLECLEADYSKHIQIVRRRWTS